RLDAESACAVFEQLVKLVGKPVPDNDPQSSTIATALNTKFEELVKATDAHLAMMAATFLEVPQYRVPGAEEAVRQISGKLKRQVDILDAVREDLDKDMRGAYARMIQAIGALSGTGIGATVTRKSNATEAIDLLRAYPRKRLQLHILDIALSVFRRLLG